MSQHTTSAEDRVISTAASFGGLANDLIEIIERLSGKLDDALRAAGIEVES